MRINVSGHHVEITDAIREAVDSRFTKIRSHFPDLDSLDVTLTVEPNEHYTEVTTQYLGETVAIRASEPADMYSAISSASKKLHSALEHRKGIAKSKSSFKRAAS